MNLSPSLFIDTRDAHRPALLRLPEDADSPAIARSLGHLRPLWNEALQAVELPRTAVTEVVAVLHEQYDEVELAYGAMERYPERRVTLRRPRGMPHTYSPDVIDYTGGCQLTDPLQADPGDPDQLTEECHV